MAKKPKKKNWEEKSYAKSGKEVQVSKVGKQPITIPEKVDVQIEGSKVTVSGPMGSLSIATRPEIKVEIQNGQVKVSRKNETKLAKSLHGLTRTIIANMIKGVTEGHQKVLEIVGVGYKAIKEGDKLILNVGYSHPVIFPKMEGIDYDTRENKIIVSGIDKVLVGETAARIRRVRPPEPYKGKGIKYLDEFIRRKAGKAIKTTTGA